MLVQGTVTHKEGITDTITLPDEYKGKTITVTIALKEAKLDIATDSEGKQYTVCHLQVSEGDKPFKCDGTFHVMCQYFGTELEYTWTAIVN
jgi:hypothetical protein